MKCFRGVSVVAFDVLTLAATRELPLISGYLKGFIKIPVSAMFCLTLLNAPVRANTDLPCSVPHEPNCVGHSGPFDNRAEFSDCRDDVEDYLQQTDAFVSCLAREAENKKSEAIRDANSAVANFNQRANH